MASTYAYYIEAYAQTYQQRFQFAVEMAMAEMKTQMAREQMIRDSIADLQKQRSKLIEAAGKKDATIARLEISYANTEYKNNEAAKREMRREVDAVERSYGSLDSAARTTSVNQAADAVRTPAAGSSYAAQAQLGAQRVRASLRSDADEGQKLLAAKQYKSDLMNAVQPGSAAASQLTEANINTIIKSKFGVDPDADIEAAKEAALSKIPPGTKPISNAQMGRVRSEIDALKGDTPQETKENLEQTTESVKGVPEIDALIAKQIKELEKMGEDDSTIMERARQIYDEEFSPVSIADRRLMRQYERLSPTEKLIAQSLSDTFKVSSKQESRLSDSNDSMYKAKELFLSGLQYGKPEENYDVVQKMKQLGLNQDDMQAVIKTAIAEFEDKIAVGEIKPSPEMQKIQDATTVRGIKFRTKVNELMGEEAVEARRDERAENRADREQFARELVQNFKQRKDVRELREIPGIQGKETEEFQFSFAPPNGAPPPPGAETIDQPIFEPGAPMVQTTQDIQDYEVGLMEGDEEQALLDILLNRYRMKRAMKGRAELPTYASGPQIPE